MTHRVFVYGTLKRNQFFHERYLGNGKAEFLGPATAGLDYSLYIDGLPHMIREKTDSPVRGELYEVNDKALRSLDELEGHPLVYFREIIDVYTAANEKVLAWAYLRHPNFKGKINAFKEPEFL